MSGAVEVNVTFYLVETFISVNVQWQVATRTVEVEIGAISHKLSYIGTVDDLFEHF